MGVAIACFSLSTVAHAWVNAGFEAGNLTGWTVATSAVTSSTWFLPMAVTVTPAEAPFTNGSELNDVHGGNYAAFVFSGDGDSSHGDWATITQSDTVPGSGACLSAYFAAVLNGHHYEIGEGYGSDAYVLFQVSVGGTTLYSQRFSWFDNAPLLLDPGSPYDAVNYDAGYGTVGPWKYLPWQQYYFDLSAYGGQTVTISYSAYSCAETSHYALGYLDDVSWGNCPTPTSSVTPTGTPSGTATVTPSATRTVTLSFTATPSPTFSPSTTPTPSFTGTATSTGTSSPTPTATPTASPTGTATPSFSASPSPSSTATSSPSVTDTGTPSATATWTTTPSFTPTPSDTPTATASFTPSPTASDTPTFSATLTATPSFTATDTASDTPTPTSSYTDSDTPSDTPSSTATPTATPSFTDTATATATSTFTATSTYSDTPTFTSTPTWTPTFTDTPSFTDTPTASDTPTSTSTSTITPTWSPSPTITQTWTPAPTIRIALHVFNAAGEIVRTLPSGMIYGEGGMTLTASALFAGQGALGIWLGGAQVGSWNGTNDGNQNVSSGLYIVQATETDSFGHTLSFTQDVQVIAAPQTTTLAVYNSTGERVRTLAATVTGAPALEVKSSSVVPPPAPGNSVGVAIAVDATDDQVWWDVRNDLGAVVTPGVYWVRLTYQPLGAPPQTQSKSVTVVEGGLQDPLEGSWAAPNPGSAHTTGVWAGLAPTAEATDFHGRVFTLGGNLIEVLAPDPSGRLFWPLGGSKAPGIYLLEMEALDAQGLPHRRILKIAVVAP